MRHIGVEPKGRCGIYGANCPEWFIAMEVRIYYATCFSLLTCLSARKICNCSTFNP
jgi:hypothetical protein